MAAPAYLARRGTPRRPAELARHDCLAQLAPSGRPTWSFGDERVAPHGPLRSNSPTALREAALAGVGVAVLPGWLIDGDLAAGRLRQLLARYPTPEITTWALHRVELRGAPRVRALIDALRADPAPPRGE